MSAHLDDQPTGTPPDGAMPAGRSDAPTECLSAMELIEQAEETFERDFTDLLQRHASQWVAYYGSRQVGIAPTRAELYQACVRRGLPEDAFVVWNIRPVMHDIAIGGIDIV